MIWAFSSFKKRKLLSILTVFLLLLTLFQAWFGAMVVATNIVPWVLTTHMLLAIVMILTQLHIIQLTASKSRKVGSKYLIGISLLGVILMIIQTVWGTQVRQQIDVISDHVVREDWMSQLTGIFYYHRTMAIALILIGISYFYFHKKENIKGNMGYYILGIVLLEGVVGKLFSVLGMPAILQPIHLVFSMILLSLFYFSFINFKSK